MLRDSLNRFVRAASMLLIGLLVVACLSGRATIAQTKPVVTGKCEGTFGSYQSAGYLVKAIRIKPLFRFMPGGAILDEALIAAMANLEPGQMSPKVNDPFNMRTLSLLNDQLSVEIERRLLTGRTGVLRVHPTLRNCDEQSAQPTLEIEYVVLTIARPSFRASSFELREGKSREKEETETIETDAARISNKPYVGYNRSRGIYGGTAFSYAVNAGLIEKMDFDASASGSSGVANASLSGSHESDSGLFSYTEWRLGYRYSNIPTDAVRLKEATGVAQFFGATRPLTGHNLFFRFGASLEGGYRQSDLSQPDLPSSVLARSGYGALKMYVGGTLSNKRQDWKASYGLQLGNSGNGASVDYVKQLFDTAYRGRFMLRPYRPLQIDARLNAGSLSTSGGGSIPVVERFFGGNAERDFILGDAWRIRSDPFIRSFPQNRLNRLESGQPIGGSNFFSVNLTIAPTVWSRQLMPREVSRDADLKTALGAQLLNTRKFLRETPIRKSKEISDLAMLIAKLDADPNPAQQLPAGPLKALKATLGCPPTSDDPLREPSSLFSPDSQELVKTICSNASDAEDTVSAAVLPPDDPKAVIVNQDQAKRFLNNPVESNARTLAVGFPDPDPDINQDATLKLLGDDAQKLRAMLETELLSLSGSTQADVAAKLRKAISELSALSNKDENGSLDKAQVEILKGMDAVKNLRAYPALKLKEMLEILTPPTPGSDNLDKHLDNIIKQLGDVSGDVQKELKDEQKKLAQLPAESDEKAAAEKRVADLQEFLALIEVASTYATKAKASHADANAFLDKQLTDETKYSLELLVVGFGGGSPAHLTGVVEGVRELRKPFAARKLTTEWNELQTEANALLSFQKRVKSEFVKLSIPVYEQEANQTVSYVGGVLDVFFRELNLVGVSPVFMFDAARLGPANTVGNGGLRYGVGAGIRFSLVNLDFTAGYSVNPNRRPAEGRGAFVFTMEINDLFR